MLAKFWNPLLYAQYLGEMKLCLRGQLQRLAAWWSTRFVDLVFYSFLVATSDNRIFLCVFTGRLSSLTGYFMPSRAFSPTPTPHGPTGDVFLSLNLMISDLFEPRKEQAAGTHFGQGGRKKDTSLKQNDRLKFFFEGQNSELIATANWEWSCWAAPPS